MTEKLKEREVSVEGHEREIEDDTNKEKGDRGPKARAEPETEPESSSESSASESEAGIKEKEVAQEVPGLLLPLDTLLGTGIHIGTRMKTRDMEPYIYRVRPDGLFILDIAKINERIKVASSFLARFDPKEIVVVSTRLYGQGPVQKFCELTGAIPIAGRFMPGTFTNPLLQTYVEPKVVVVTDPRADEQPVREASVMGLPVIALCDTDNILSNVDLVIPCNNKGRRSLATVFWLLARQVLRNRKELPEDKELPVSIEEFETKTERKAEES
jgi:small subunit ribosomal protein S2